eukprot:CAMPEP_0197174328 /NCGR_PEP_ID=MMETSP1423-20130617/896_1 /TAXON_ID=476441 /ORGANISM="Pseudo-nitzschia heimii, Strain UNC1101" /LENGTH=219 /DNA_ID=CAMNT_0042623245 /DNA_START=220 /DNA_END=879 /DNA_ORIENTATION=+
MRTIPKELDILPPRPVLFPWLPSTAECLLDFGLASCCFGGEKETAALEKHPASRAAAAAPPGIRSVFSFDDDEEEEKFVDCMDGTEGFESESSTVSGDDDDDRHNRRSLKPLFGEETVASGENTTTILVLSRDDDNEIPDMSPSDDNSEAGSYRSSDVDDDGSRDHKKSFGSKATLVSLTDVLAEVLRFLMIFVYANGGKARPLIVRNHEPQKHQVKSR